MPLLLHSLSEFWPLIETVLDSAGCRRIVEVGGEEGQGTRLLLEYASRVSGSVVTIDPSPAPSTVELLSASTCGKLIRELSLIALPEINLADAYLLDGDHNYYTVLHELAIIFGRHQKAGTHPLVILHDVGWPCGRRDFYYKPESIPLKWLQPHTWSQGVTLGNPGVIDGGFRGCGNFALALREGGERNGVRTAVEDFLELCGEPLEFKIIPVIFGLGLVYSPSTPWAASLDKLLFHRWQNDLLETLEINRLENYLKVIELQDRSSPPA